MKHRIIRILFVLTLLLVLSTVFALPASAVTRNLYWVGDGGNWSNTAHWSLASGGAGGEAVPDADDNVFFDAASFTIGGQVVTIDIASPCLDMDWTGVTNTPDLAGSALLAVYGSLTFSASMTKSYSGSLRFYASAPGETITANGALACDIVFYVAGGGWTLQDALNIGAKSILLYQGALDTNGQTVTCGLFDTNYDTVRGLTLGASVINCTAWTLGATNLTWDGGTSSIRVTGTGAFTGGGKTYYEVQLNGSAHAVSGSNTFTNFILPADTTQTITFADGTNQTITNATITGSVGKIKTLQGSGVAGWTITKAGGSYVAADYLNLSYSTASPVLSWGYGAHSTIGANVIGWGLPYFFIDIDGVEQDRVIAVGVSVPDNAYPWIFIENGSMLYLESQTITVGGVPVQGIAWEYTAGDFIDSTLNGNDATPSYRTASSDADVSGNMTSFSPIAEAKAPSYVLSTPNPFLDSSALTSNITGTFGVTPTTGTFPLAGVVKAVADATSTPAQLPLLVLAGFVILAISLTMSYLMRRYGSGTIFVKIIVIVAVMGIFVALKNFGIDFWMVVVFLIISIALAMASRQLGWT